MKKSKSMRLASALLVLTLLSTCMISGTFAKYTTKDDATDEARVAKFGVTVNATDDSAFKTEYETTDTKYTGSLTVKVDSESTDNLVAPGTDGTFTKVSLTGKPEVAVRVSYVGTLTLTGWEVEGTKYCPIEIKVGDTTYKKASAEELKTAVEAAILAYSKDYAPGTDLSTVGDDNLAISWSWAYEGNDDALDTKLGDAGTATIKLDVTTTVTQID